MKIFTHVSVDLDAAFSVAATRQYIPGARYANVEFRSANWDGAEMGPGDIAVDVEAGGHGIKGLREQDGTTHSCFAAILVQHAPEEDRRALRYVTAFIDAQDAHGTAIDHLAPALDTKARDILFATGLNAVLRAFQADYDSDDLTVVKRMEEIFRGMLRAGKTRLAAEKSADQAERFGDGSVALVENAPFATIPILQTRGVRIVVHAYGMNLAVRRRDGETVRMDHPVIREVVRAAGEEGEWFSHPKGFLFCRGDYKAPATTPSKVQPRELALAAVRALSET